jgi:hypothetical protein
MHRSKPANNQPQLFTVQEVRHDGSLIGSQIDYTPEPPQANPRPDIAYFDSAAKEKADKIKALEALDTHLSDTNRSKALNLSRMTPDHPLAKRFDLVGNAANAEGILNEAEIYLLQACGHCGLKGSGCQVGSNIKKFAIKHPTAESRRGLIDGNRDNPLTGC